MNNIIEPDISFEFSRLHLGHPTELPGKSYFTKLFYVNKPLYIQTPKCLTKQGFLLNGKKNYCDLMFDSNDSLFIQWFESLENKCQELLFEKREEWFQNTLEKGDIETSFTSPIKIFKSGKYYLIRVNLKPSIKIYNEIDEIISLEKFPVESNIVSILEIKGIKFTSRNFQFEFELKQSMIVSPDPFLDTCFIKKGELETTDQKNKNFEKTVDETVVKSNQNGLESDPINLDETINSNQPKYPLLENIKLTIDHSNGLEEVNINIDTSDEPIVLKKPTNYYYNLYETAKQKAKDVKNQAIAAYLEAKHIKDLHKLEDFDEDFGEDFENFDKL